jgi:hypothetical protein
LKLAELLNQKPPSTEGIMDSRRVRFRVQFVFAVGCAYVCGCSDVAIPVTTLTNYRGQTKQDVEARLGTPERTESFPMSQAVGEFRAPLFSTYPLSNPANADVTIEECWWRDGDYWITLWFHQQDGKSVALEGCRWHEGVRF